MTQLMICPFKGIGAGISLPAPIYVPRWRNWQTQGICNPPAKSPCGFESRPRHHYFSRMDHTFS